MNITKFLGYRIPLAFAGLATALLSPSPVHAAQGLVLNPKEIGGYVDLGQAFSDPDKQPLTRTGAYLTASGIYNERLQVRATLGGLFWYAFPELTSSSRVVRFGPGVGQAQAIYSFGEDPLNNPAAKLQFGLFPLKYNPDAANLGEYLYRSGTYPGYVWTGGWSYLNSASFLMQGARFTMPTLGGKLTHDITLHMERDLAQPLHDFSPGYMVTYKPTPFVEVGGGVVWSNALSFTSKRLAPKTLDNAYSKTTGMPVLGINDALCSSTDPALQALCADPDSTRAAQTWADWQSGNVGYYSFRGFKTMGRISLDVGALLGTEAIRPGEFKLYTEAALLGVEDQPFYYEDKMERLPIMAGIRIPTFGLLDRLSVEAEYRKSRFPNSFAYPFDNRGALPLPLGGDGDLPYDYTNERVEADPDAFNKDDWKWSVYASRILTQGVTLTAQIASDHLRPPSNVANPPSIPYTLTPGDWYYVMRVSFGI